MAAKDKDNESYHQPVMADEVVKLLITDPEGAYIELTAGTGGHLRALAEALGPQASLYGMDKDSKAVELATDNLGGYKQVKKIIRGSYTEIDKVADQIENIPDKEFDGIFLDLGLSSQQLDDPARGFSFSSEGPLDMRFDQQSLQQTAAELINSLSEHELSGIIRTFGEERLAPRIARSIVRERQKGKIQTTGQLTRLVRTSVKSPHQTKSLARVFQALRIVVNHELEELQAGLPKAFDLLTIGGRMAVISYHSLEDRIVKQFFQSEVKGCICPPQLPKCVCNRKPRAQLITRKALTPQKKEIEQNPRSRSAKLRVVEKIAA
jgi:16S rRNA (cytosine1402-N4)-methyltransferase